MAEKSNPYASAAESYETKESQPWISGMGKDMTAQQGSPNASVTENRPLVSRKDYKPCPLPVQYHENVFMIWLTRIFLLVAILDGLFVYGMSRRYIAKFFVKVFGQSFLSFINYFAYEFRNWADYFIFAAFIPASVLLYALCKRPSHGYNKTRMFLQFILLCVLLFNAFISIGFLLEQMKYAMFPLLLNGPLYLAFKQLGAMRFEEVKRRNKYLPYHDVEKI